MLAILALSLAMAAAAPLSSQADVDRVVQAERSALDTQGIEQFLRSLDAEIQPYLPDFQAADSRGSRFNLVEYAKRLIRGFVRELAMNAHLLGELILLAVLCAILAHLGHSFSAQSVSQLAFYTCYLVMTGLVINSFLATVRLGQAAVGNLTGFMYALLPVVCSLLAAAGAASTSALFSPLIIGAVATVGHLVQQIVFPLAILTAIVSLVSHLAEGFSLTRLTSLLRDLTVGLTGVILAVFIGVISIRGVTASVADGIGWRTAKYVSGTFVPVVGKGLSDAMEAVAGCSLVLKNTIGGLGAWTLLALTSFPLLKILALVAVYRLAAAFVQPFGETRFVETLNAVGNSFTLFFAVTALVGLAFFLGLTILVALGNLSFALR